MTTLTYEQAKKIVSDFGSNWINNVSAPTITIAPTITPTLNRLATISSPSNLPHLSTITSRRNDGYLTEDLLRVKSPSVFQSESFNRTDKYTTIKTIDVINELKTLDFYPVRAEQSRTIREDKKEFVKHMLRFRHVSTLGVTSKEYIPEIVMINSHDGSTAYKIMFGIFRLVCANGLIVANSMFSSQRLRHTGGDNTLERVKAHVISMSESTRMIDNKIDQWQGITLDVDQQRDYAQKAFDVYRGNTDLKTNVDNLIKTRHYQDRAKSDLWTVYNTVQENLQKGYFYAQQENGNVQRARAIKSIDRNVKFNQGLWQLTEDFGNN